MTINKPTIYLVLVVALALLWNLVWIVQVTCDFYHWPYRLLLMADRLSTGLIGDSDPWTAYPAILYYIVVPLLMLTISIVLTWKERSYRKEHPFNVAMVFFLSVFQMIISAEIYHTKAGWY